MALKPVQKEKPRLETMIDIGDGWNIATERRRATAEQLPDSALAKLADHALIAAHNACQISKEQLDAEHHRRNDRARRAKWVGREMKLDALGLVEMLELKSFGWLTDEKLDRQRARLTRRNLELKNYWMKHRPDLQIAARTHDEELMLLSDTDLMQLRNALINGVNATAVIASRLQFTLEELNDEYGSRYAVKTEAV